MKIIFIGGGGNYFLMPKFTMKSKSSTTSKIDIPKTSKTYRTPLCRPGGKTYLLNEILSRIPEHKIYVEPFVGSGAVFFSKPPAELSVLNDKDKGITDILQFMKEGGKCSATRMTKKKFNRIKNKTEKTPCDQFTLMKTSWGCNALRFASTKVPKGRLRTYDFSEYQDLLKNVIIMNEDFRETIKKYDSPETFFYIDPPYVVDYCHYPVKELCDIIPQDIVEAVQNLKGKILISYNDHPSVRDAFHKKQWTITEIQSKWRINIKSKISERQELFISDDHPLPMLLISNF